MFIFRVIHISIFISNKINTLDTRTIEQQKKSRFSQKPSVRSIKKISSINRQMLVLLKHEISLEYFRTMVWVEDRYIRVLQIIAKEHSRAWIILPRGFFRICGALG